MVTIPLEWYAVLWIETGNHIQDRNPEMVTMKHSRTKLNLSPFAARLKNMHPGIGLPV